MITVCDKVNELKIETNFKLSYRFALNLEKFDLSKLTGRNLILFKAVINAHDILLYHPIGWRH